MAPPALVLFVGQLCAGYRSHPRFKYRLIFQKPAKSSNRAASRRGSSRPARGRVRRFHDIENVIVEEPFTLFRPADGNSGGDAEEDRQAGDGCYVTTTVHNRRYYGLLVDQEALKSASLLWFQEEAASLDLNRRMQLLRDRQAHIIRSDIESQANGGEGKRPSEGSPESLTKETKRLKLDSGEVAGISTISPVPDAVPSNIPVTASNLSQGFAAEVGKLLTPAHQRQVQKFRYVPPTGNSNAADLGYRILLATYADVEAASEDDQEAARLINKACLSGGGYVGKYYYQFEVSWVG
jgi:hypothetical protein